MYGGEVDVCRQNGDSRDEQLLKKGLMMAEDKPVVESFQLDHTKVEGSVCALYRHADRSEWRCDFQL